MPNSIDWHRSDLVDARKACRICVESNPDEIVAGDAFDFDPNVFSYWSQWLGHLKPEILIVGQDFGDWDYFQRFRGRDDPASETNRHLYQLLVHIGFSPTLPPIPDSETPVFLTNAILCLKKPPMNSRLRTHWVRACATRHLRPLIRRLSPHIVVAMGGPAWAAVRIALELSNVPDGIGRAAGGSWLTREGYRVFAVGHCSGLGIRNRSWNHQLADWSRIGQARVRKA